MTALLKTEDLPVQVAGIDLRDRPVDQALMDILSVRYEREMVAQGLSVQADRARKERIGGVCAICSKPYLETVVKNRFADFRYFRAQCECEQTEQERSERRQEIEQTLIESGVPAIYRGATFETWDYGIGDERAGTNRAMKVVMEYCKAHEYREHGLILYGPWGTGKTRCAVSVMRRAVSDGWSVLFIPTASLVGRFVNREKGKEYVDTLAGYRMVCFDDMDKIGAENEWVRDRVFEAVDRLIGQGGRIVATANYREPSEFDAKFGGAVVSRLIGACNFLELPGDDYRHRQAEMTAKSRKG